MVNQDDVRRIALALPGTTEATKGFAFSVEHKGKSRRYVWVWMERIHPKKPRVPQPAVIAARVADQTDKATLLAADPDTFFTSTAATPAQRRTGRSSKAATSKR